MKIIDSKKIVVVEGVSVLCEQLAPFFHKKILVVSDKSNELEAIMLRENMNIQLWNNLYLPSVDIYWRSKPWERADILYAGRGITNKDCISMFLI